MKALSDVRTASDRSRFPPPPAGMLTITDFIIILHRYYKSPMVGRLCARLLPAAASNAVDCCVSGADL